MARPARSHLPPCQQHLRNAFFENLQQRMCQASCFDEIVYLAKRHEAAIENYAIHCLDLVADGYDVDEASQQLYPADGPALTPVSIYGDGNCLPRCGSLLAFGQEDEHVELRVRLACELALNADVYLDDAFLGTGMDKALPFAKFYATYTSHYTVQGLTPDAIRDIFQLEVQEWVHGGTFAGMWQVHALSSVLGVALQSVYPQHGGFNVRPHLHRVVFPRQAAAATASAPPQLFVPGVMWTSTHGSAVPPRSWAPNHFVVCLPEDTEACASCTLAIPTFIGILWLIIVTIRLD